MNSVTFNVAGVEFTVYSDDQTDSLAEPMKGIAKESPEFFQAVAEIQQAAIAAEVMTAKTSPRTPSVPSNVSAEPPTDVPTCPHGLMTDLRGKTYQGGPKQGQPYPHKFYCTAGRDDKTRCAPRD